MANPIDFVTGNQVDGKTFGRPAGVTVDPRGALIVADDFSNMLRRIAPDAAPIATGVRAAPAATRG